MHCSFESCLFTQTLAIDCGPLMAPINGSISGDKTTYPNLLRFECDEGFTLNGFNERHCQANGKWSGNATFCQGGTNLLNYESFVSLLLLLFFFNAFNHLDNRLHDTDLLSFVELSERLWALASSKEWHIIRGSNHLSQQNQLLLRRWIHSVGIYC